jgi:hypothetical protein
MPRTFQAVSLLYLLSNPRYGQIRFTLAIRAELVEGGDACAQNPQVIMFLLLNRIRMTPKGILEHEQKMGEMIGCIPEKGNIPQKLHE